MAFLFLQKTKNILKGHFSKQSDTYARSRPKYPEELFQFLSSLCIEKKLVWDCATGNGQAAFSLANYFEKVIATDFSEQQISNAFQKENIFYKVESAENSSLQNHSVDLITVATAAHWFNIEKFYEEVNRVLKPNGILALWSYATCSINEEIDLLTRKFDLETMNDYWPKANDVNRKEKYKTLPFPYEKIATPTFFATAEYNFEDLMNYLFSWSGVQEYIRQHNSNPIDFIKDNLHKLWGDENQKRKISWKLHMLCGRNSPTRPPLKGGISVHEKIIL